MTHGTGSLFSRVGCFNDPRMITHTSRQILNSHSPDVSKRSDISNPLHLCIIMSNPTLSHIAPQALEFSRRQMRKRKILHSPFSYHAPHSS